MIEQLMKNASEAYYSGQPILTNEQYDALEKIHGQIISGNGEVPHAYRMYSLKKHYEKDGPTPLNLANCVGSDKLDGAAVSILYVDGELVYALTRGDGVKGNFVTSKIAHLGIPEAINLGGVVQITGEVVARKDVENSRNYASGALNLKDMSQYYQRVRDGSMVFVAYNIQIREDYWGIADDYMADLDIIENLGFKHIKQKDWHDDYPIDGQVYRLNNTAAFNAAGFTDRFPKGAYALKEEQEGVETTLLDVQWQTGKSGKVTPIAILEPVVIGEANVSRATLNNMAFIEALNLEIGCRVSVIRSGEIIPCIVARVD